jgi:hypothetical protein
LIEYILWKKNHRKASKIDKLARVLVPTLCLLSYIFLLLLELS